MPLKWNLKAKRGQSGENIRIGIVRVLAKKDKFLVQNKATEGGQWDLNAQYTIEPVDPPYSKEGTTGTNY